MPCKAKCPGRPSSSKKIRINPLAVIPHAHSEAFVVVFDSHLNAPRLCVPERIAQCLASNPVNFVAQDGMQTLRARLLYPDENAGTLGPVTLAASSFARGADRLRQIVGLDCR